MSELSLYDIVGTEGVAADLSHINTGAKARPCRASPAGAAACGKPHSQAADWQMCVRQVSGHTGAAALGAALYGCRLVVIPAGVPRKPGMTRDDLFNINAGQRALWPPTAPARRPRCLAA